MTKSTRKIYQGEKNNKERTKTKLISAVGKVLKKKGYTGLTVSNISKEAGVDRKLIYLYFENVENLIETYIRSKDYWIKTTNDTIEDIGNLSTGKSKNFLESLLLSQLDNFAQNIEMQKVVTWQISEKSNIMSQITREREKMSAVFFAMADKELKNKNVDIRAISSIMVAGIYYLVLHAKYTESTFCEIELNEEGFNRIRSSIKDILNWVYEEKAAI